jgi:hypothetical protein
LAKANGQAGAARAGSLDIEGLGLEARPMRRDRLTGLPTLVVGLLLPTALLACAAYGGALVRQSLEQLTRSADLIVVGRVAGVRSFWNPDRSLIISHVSIAVTAVIKGSDRPGEVVVRQAGGEIRSEDIGQRVSGSARFSVGEELVAFLQAPSAIEKQRAGATEAYFRLVGREQGKYRVVTAAGAPVKMAVRDVEATLVDPLTGQVVPGGREAVPLPELLRAIRAALQGQSEAR